MEKEVNILISETYLLDFMRRTKNDVIFNLARLVSFIHCPLSSIRLGGRVMKILVGHNRPKTFWSWTLGIKNSLLMEIVLSWAHIITKSTRMKVCGFPGSRFQNRGSSGDKLVERIDCVSTRSEQAANWCREPDVEKWGNWCRQLTRRFGPEIWKKRPYVVSPLNSIEWIRLHWFCNTIKNHFHSLIHIKRNCYKKLANCLRTNGMKGRNGERKLD